VSPAPAARRGPTRERSRLCALEGASFAHTFDDPDAKSGKQTQFYSMGGTRAIWHQGWKASAISPSAPDAWAAYSTQRWELFDTENDPCECHDLADQRRAVHRSCRGGADGVPARLML
jgi:arylsulfatase A-like enzyme